MAWKDWLPIIQLVFAGLIVPSLAYIIRLGTRQNDQKSELTATNVQVEQVKKDVGGVKEDVKALNQKLDEHGKILYKIEGILTPGPSNPNL